MEREFTMEEGKAGDEVVLDSPDMKFGDKAIRRGFIRKVYMILSVQVRNKSVKISWEFYFLGIVKQNFPQLSFTVASIVFFTFYIPQQYCTDEEKKTLLEKFSTFFMSTAREYNSTEEQDKNEKKLMLSLCAM